jgi:hypothetical protein
MQTDLSSSPAGRGTFRRRKEPWDDGTQESVQGARETRAGWHCPCAPAQREDEWRR